MVMIRRAGGHGMMCVVVAVTVRVVGNQSAVVGFMVQYRFFAFLS